jgi:hypothetical protein
MKIQGLETGKIRPLWRQKMPLKEGFEFSVLGLWLKG